LLGERRAVDLQTAQRADGSQLAALYLIHGEDGAGAVVRHRLRHLDQLEFLEILAERDQVARFARVVQLVMNAGAKLVHDHLEAVASAHLGVRIDELGELLENVEVVGDLFADVGPLDLDDDVASVP
jgi:hypothetical protein